MSSPLDQTSGVYSGTASLTTLQPGSLTPSQASNNLIIANEGNFVGTGTGATASINLGFTITNQDLSTYGGYCGSGLAYLVQAVSAAINPTWTLSSGTNQYDFIANMAIFQGTAAGGNYANDACDATVGSGTISAAIYEIGTSPVTGISTLGFSGDPISGGTTALSFDTVNYTVSTYVGAITESGQAR
jgi:hypothetical protein